MKTILRTVVLGMAMAGVTGCNSLSGDALQTMKLAISGPESPVTIERVNAVNGPALSVRLGVAEAMLVTRGSATGVVEWYGITEMLLTQHGRVTQSAGLPFDIIAPLVSGDPFNQGLLTVADGLEITRQVDYPAQYLTGLRQHAHYERGPLEEVEFMGQRHMLQRVDEHIRMPELDFKATNHYWLEPDTGLVRRSTQYIAPDLPPLHLTLLKTAGGQP
ncbi:Group 4 capsule polysaccharide lipoprotein gfcB, YjbF [Halopseudomonas litoralis]|uniref:Group 4 capsule polysaccharide lipoprotein gfcB, YjbF n=1 Tax=Halopseudomonas litoralis TaxID=797277 RepID=A0A1H1SAQ6_9GAMM|nr:YjbF family lipoprotein [Halopseudomonas litoralis]SDS45011.1 Group 4 capsule polysaccharide lipoprotein gfcB, YjbF [Halopseudomonas litoralis]